MTTTASNLVPTFGKCCSMPAPRVIAEREILTKLLDADRGDLMWLPVRAYCEACRQVLHPQVAAFVPQAVVDADRRVTGAIARCREKIGQRGTAAELGLPSWTEIAENVPLPRLDRNAVFADYNEAHRNGVLPQRMKAMVGLTRGRVRRDLEMPAEIVKHLGDVPHVSIDTVNHVKARRDVEHLRPWPVLPHVAARPVEAWLVQQTDETNKPSLLVIGGYHLGAQLHFHVLVIKPSSGWVITAYALRNFENRLTQRDGVLLYTSYGAREAKQPPV